MGTKSERSADAIINRVNNHLRENGRTLRGERKLILLKQSKLSVNERAYVLKVTE